MVSRIHVIGYIDGYHTDKRSHSEALQDGEHTVEVILIDFKESVSSEKLDAIIKQITNTVARVDLLSTLNLSGCSFKQFPFSLSGLSLTHLDLSNNRLETIPDCLYSSLQNLQHLNLCNNNIGSFEREPLCVANLKTLNLSRCKFQNPPTWFLQNKCVNLETFIYCYNRSVDFGSGNTKNIVSSIKNLVFKNCSLTHKDYNYFSATANLECLNLSNGGMSQSNVLFDINTLLDKPSWCHSMKILKLKNLGIIDLPSSIGLLVCLEELHLQHNYIASLPDEVIFLRRLRVLKIGYNDIYLLPQKFRELKLLERLEAQFNTIGSVDLRDMPELKYVDLYSNDLDSIELDDSEIHMIDLENNHITDTTTVCCNYTEKKNRLRVSFGRDLCRVDGCKEEEKSERSSDISEEFNVIEDNSQDNCGDVNEEESWDGSERLLGHHDVSGSDNEYNGETIPQNMDRNIHYLYSYEDYLFVDAD